MGTARIILYYHDFFAPDSLDIILWKIANTIILAGFIFLLNTIESHVYKKTKHSVTVLVGILTILYVLFPDKMISTFILYGATALSIMLVLVVYLIIAKKSTGDLRKKALIIVVGIFILMVGSGTGLFEIINLIDRTTALILGPPLSLLGFIICGYGFITMNK